ncbi:MAG: PqqD family protein [Clostridia bacterium]|nr:PqqD family protein [Clostridia bacterium]
MKIKQGFVVRKVGNDVFAVSTRADFNGMVKLNETAAMLWEYFQTEHTAEEGALFLCQSYEVSPEKAKADVEKFLKSLRESDILQ